MPVMTPVVGPITLLLESLPETSQALLKSLPDEVLAVAVITTYVFDRPLTVEVKSLPDHVGAVAVTTLQVVNPLATGLTPVIKPVVVE